MVAIGFRGKARQSHLRAIVGGLLKYRPVASEKLVLLLYCSAPCASVSSTRPRTAGRLPKEWPLALSSYFGIFALAHFDICAFL